MVIVALSLLLAASSPDCRQAYEELRYREAVERCSQALPTLSREQRPEAYRLLALSLAALGDHAAATQAFVSLLALDPAATLASSYAPRIRADLEEARRSGGGAPVRLELRALAPTLSGAPIKATLEIDDGPARPVTELSVDGGPRISRHSAERVELSAQQEPGPRAVELVAFDRFGGRLAEEQATILVAAPAPASLLRSPVLWGGASVAAAAAGGILGAVALSSQALAQSDHFADEAAAHEARGNREAIAADVCFGAAGALAVAAIVLFALGDE